MKRKRITVLVIVCLLVLSLPLPSRSITIEEEKKYGRDVFNEIAKSATINSDPYIVFYLQGMKERLESKTVLPFPIVLTVIEAQSVDAFATIGGYVFMTTALLALCDREEELAGVLAHEFAHIGKRHIAKRMEKEKYLTAGMLASILAAMLVGDAQTKAAVLTTGTASAQALSLKYSREDEEEADRTGATTADRAGYSAIGIADFLKKLRSTALEKTLPQYLLTHPYHEERISRIESSWAESRTTVDTSFFAYLLVRARVIHRPPGSGAKDIWITKYAKDRKDPLNGYGAALAYALDGNMKESIEVLEAMDSPYKKLFLGEALLGARRFEEAMDALKDERHPVGRLLLAKAYEGAGNLEAAAASYRELAYYGQMFPEIYYRLGMLVGRMGEEASGYENLGKYHLSVGRISTGQTYLEKAVAKYGLNTPKARELMEIIDSIDPKKKEKKK